MEAPVEFDTRRRQASSEIPDEAALASARVQYDGRRTSTTRTGVREDDNGEAEEDTDEQRHGFRRWLEKQVTLDNFTREHGLGVVRRQPVAVVRPFRKECCCTKGGWCQAPRS